MKLERGGKQGRDHYRVKTCFASLLLDPVRRVDLLGNSGRGKKCGNGGSQSVIEGRGPGEAAVGGALDEGVPCVRVRLHRSSRGAGPGGYVAVSGGR